MSVQPALSLPTRPADLRPELEFDLLLACCSDSSNRDARIRAILRQPVYWHRLAEAAEHHGVIPVVYESLSRCRDLVPTDALAMIEQLYESNVRRTLWLTRELGRVLEQLRAADVPVIPYKGPVLAHALYGNLTRRQFSDLDLLIHVQDFSRARSALIELGFRPGIQLSPAEERAHLHSGYELTFDSPNGRNLLELQWQIVPRFYAVDFDVDGFFNRARTLDAGGITVRSLCPEDLLLVLCVHAAKHAWIQLSWLCDIAELAKSHDLDWTEIQNQSSALGITRIVNLTFSLAHGLLGAPLPPTLSNDDAEGELRRQVSTSLTHNQSIDPECLAYFHLLARLRERRRDRMRFWWRLAVTPMAGEWSAIRLPAPLFPLYRVVRAFRLARRLF